MAKKSHFPNKIKATLLVVTILSSFTIGKIDFAAPEPVITLTFDDAALSQYQYAAPIIKAAGQKATIYVPSGLIGTEGYMTWNNLVSMVQEGWEVGGHSVDHSELPLLTPEEIEAQVRDNYELLAAHGLQPVSFATPFGAYDNTVIADIASYFENHRGYHDIGYNAWPYNEYLLYVQQITNQTTLAEVESWIQEATANNYWLIIVFHEILPTVAIDDTYSWPTADLEALMALLDSYGIKTKSIAETLNMKDSLLPNSDFNNGLADGWTTPTPAQVFVDGGGRGAVPTPASSVELMGGAASAYLYGPSVSVSSTTEYGVRIFNNTVNLQSGEFGYYFDEYNNAGDWISWKFLGTSSPNNVIDESYAYQPASADIASVGLRIYLAAGSVGYVYVDNADFFEMGEGAPLPTPNPIASLLPYPPLQNSDFSGGVAEGWTTDNTAQVAFSTTSRGILPTAEANIKMDGGALAAHVFSPQVQVDSAKSYDVTAYIDATDQTAGETGLYMDEYDQAEAWVSGKWLGYQPIGYAGNLAFKYQPTNDLVMSASVQVYMTANSTGAVYLDNVDLNITAPEPLPAALPFANSDFGNGISDGWHTNRPEQVTLATTSRGVDPTADASVKMTGSDSSAHLFSPKALVDSTEKYAVKAHIDTVDLTSGEAGCYLDEYNDAGNWISGKWLGYAPLSGVNSLEYSYQPSSAQVYSASVQIYLTALASGEAYIDNVEMAALAPEPEPAEPPLPNSDFSAGLADGWTVRNSEQVQYSTTSRGVEPTVDANIKMTGGGSSAHLFSPQALVASSSQYNVSAFVDATGQISGEAGLYVDEYDLNNNWLSGKWLGYQTIGQSGIVTYDYTPTSAMVFTASIQTYLVANSTGEIYIDNVQLDKLTD